MVESGEKRSDLARSSRKTTLDEETNLHSLEALLSARSLPDDFVVKDTFEDRVQVGELLLNLAGCAARGSAGLATGSAASRSAPPRERAVFELLERCALLIARQHQSPLPTLSPDGNPRGTVPHERVFPQCPKPERQQHAISSGVAAGPTFSFAAQRAEDELIERDLVLGSFYGRDPIEEVASPDTKTQDALRALYEMRFFVVPSREGMPQRFAAVTLGVPIAPSDPLLLGFGVNADAHAATLASLDEALQRLGFLYGDPIAITEPPFAPNAGYHQEHSLWLPARPRILSWLAGEHTRFGGQVPRGVWEPTTFVDLTPSALRGEIVVVRALQPGCLPLVFGDGHPDFDVPGGLRTHPVS